MVYNNIKDGIMFFGRKVNFEDKIKEINSQIEKGKFSNAQKMLLKLLKNKDFPENLTLQAARIFFKTKDYKKALEYYQLGELHAEPNTNDLLNLVEITNQLNLSEECKTYCEKVLETDSDNLKILDILLQHQISQNSLYSAIDTIDKMLVIQKNIVDFNKLKLLKSNIFYDLKQYDNAEKVILEILETEENNAKYLRHLADIYREKQMKQELLTVLKNLYSQNGQIQDAREIATILFEQKNYNDAENFIMSCSETDFYIKKILIETNIAQEKYNAALDRLNAFLLDDNQNFEFYKLKATVLIKKQQFKAAIDLLQNSVDFVDTVFLEEINTLLKNVHIAFSKYLLSKKNYEQAFAVLENTSKYGSEDDIIYYTIAKCNFEIRDYKKALLNLSKAIEINPTNFDAYELMSKIYLQNDNIEQAILHQLEAVKINPANFYALAKLGFLYSQNTDFNSALIYFLKANAINGNDSNINYNIALCYHKLNNTEEARKYYERALEIDNSNSNALTNLEILNKTL